ncbi:CAF1 family ribonuclease containing protein [Tritrichomonas foetus]|uniref:poly(A)-specific ribonuclease n=1 Tax=Tritrichomonas foetus TaxID=1144522 RepID=A0A1J4KE82_9EUKA|nr:CAF1 family ribonuclease containing protein [Tritrichomonas foetus]|eukprot:OHT09737.1 CAF1 family ribonuclease containing protein [Tritrichomonas foetus]
MTEDFSIRDVWAHNLEQEMAIISDLLDDYPYVAMDTEFPGVIAKPIGQFSSQESFNYHLMRCNVDFLKIIQIGITLGDGRGNFPTPCCTWQFNFKFNLEEDMNTTSAIDLLQQSGIDFSRFNSDGINVFDFSQLLYTSGLVMNDDIFYITFHSSSDFGYLIKMLTCKPLPREESEFFKLLNVMFPHYYDLKLMADDNDQISCGGLQALANELNVMRVGPQHQAGSDALVTLKTFTALMDTYFDGKSRNKKFENILYGLDYQKQLDVLSEFR